MTYTGKVRPGGPAEHRRLDQLSITKFSVGDMDNNVYLLRCSVTGEQLLIDAADDADRILTEVGPDGLNTVITTHRHWDHVRATAEVVDRTGATGLAHVDDSEAIPAVTRTVRDGDTVPLGATTVDIIHLVGHTPGSIAVLYREPGGRAHLFTGDSLFPGGVGRTESPEDFRSLIDDVEHKLFDRFGDDTRVYPGHGDDTTLGVERPHLAAWRSRGW